MTSETKECPFCAETIKAKAIYCRFCGHYLDGREQAGGDETSVGDVKDSLATAVGTGANAEVKLGKELRDEQYEIVQNWDGERPMREFDLAGRDLSGFALENADLRKANLTGADLTKSKLTKAKLSLTDMRDAKLVGAELSYAKLGEAKLCRADLSCGTYFQTDMTGADLSGANLEGAQLTMVNLSNAILRDVDLSNTNIAIAYYTEKTIWPDDFDTKSIMTICFDEEGVRVIDVDGNV